jgi:hypothetical protein
MDLSDELQSAVAEARAKLRIGYPWWLRPFLQPSVIAITLGRRVYVLPSFLNRDRAEVERLIRHELEHVRQVNRLTLPVFLVRYGYEFVRNVIRERSIDRAYRAISFEKEAYAAEEKHTSIIG